MRRDPAGILLILMLILGLGIVVWATRHPDSELLERAERWPLAGPLVERFRVHYRPPHQEQTVDETGTPVVSEAGESEGETQLRPVRKVVWVRAGTQLRSGAEGRAGVIGMVDEMARLPVLERRGGWYRVLVGDRIAWVFLPDYDAKGVPPLGSDPSPPQPLPGRAPDAELLATAVGLLTPSGAADRLGPYELYTDLDDPFLLSALAGIAETVEPVYSTRYGIDPIDRPREAIVLFAREEDYRSFQNSLDRLVGLPAVGLVSRGVVAIFVGERGASEVGSTLIHELVHLLNRRALGPALPAWLDEGLADDLSYSQISASGELTPEELGGSSVDLGSVTIWKGGRAAALELERALMTDRAVPLEELVSLEWESFVDPEMRLHYPQSALLVRYLIESEPQLREGFRAYLRGIAAGESVSAATLLGHLGSSWTDLESGFRSWALERFGDLS